MDGASVLSNLEPGLLAPGGIRRVLVILNPAARGAQRALPVVLNALGTSDVECVVAETDSPAHACVLVREHLSVPDHGFDAVFSLGGDGTAMEVATELADWPDAPPLGIIAVGTANVLARSLGVPLKPAAAVRMLLTASPVAIDLGKVDGGPRFAIGLGIGLDATMITGASNRLKRTVGYLAYVWSALRAGLRLERFTARITVDGVTLQVEASSVLVANFGTVLGDLLCFGEQVGHRDGLLNVCVYSPRTLRDAVRIFWRMARGGVSDDPGVHILTGRVVRIETDTPRPIQADGELLGLTPVDIRVEPGAVRILLPNSPPSRSPIRRTATIRVRTTQNTLTS